MFIAFARNLCINANTNCTVRLCKKSFVSSDSCGLPGKFVVSVFCCSVNFYGTDDLWSKGFLVCNSLVGIYVIRLHLLKLLLMM